MKKGEDLERIREKIVDEFPDNVPKDIDDHIEKVNHPSWEVQPFLHRHHASVTNLI